MVGASHRECSLVVCRYCLEYTLIHIIIRGKENSKLSLSTQQNVSVNATPYARCQVPSALTHVVVTYVLCACVDKHSVHFLLNVAELTEKIHTKLKYTKCSLILFIFRGIY